MVGTVVFPTLSGLRRASSRRQQVAGPVCCSLMATVWCPGCRPGPRGWQGRASALVVDPPGGQGPGAAEPGQLQQGRALDSLSIRA